MSLNKGVYDKTILPLGTIACLARNIQVSRKDGSKQAY